MATNPVGTGHNYRQTMPVPKEAPVRSKEQPAGSDWFGIDSGWGGEHANRYWDGMTKAEIWTGLQKLKYCKDGTWSGQNSDFFDIGTINAKSTQLGPTGSDSQHP